ncbi:hypothetical protein ACFPTR_06270 [Aliibacillus thermotolerans]|uniref:Uncharacterized protein n=1 Tax=Aliibacillus thermotolerans TaxID=1834418 RepID=A0ABW0U8B5_9BACI|nr:hypothetical protein [Aliibacillus thermotolerans]
MAKKERRYRVTIRCLSCGERFLLRGRKDEDGNLTTGFKRCICGNDKQLHIDYTEE